MTIHRILLGLLAGLSLLTAADRPVVPDLTAGGRPDQSHDWRLGPTGARGWMWGWHCQTTNARQILVTEVAIGSPADGVLAKDDVLLGIGGTLFSDDARFLLAQAITAAEAGDGNLRLLRWRAGQRAEVTVRLPVIGAYAPTAPWDCPKTKRILEQGCQAIARQGFADRKGQVRVSIENDCNALLLLAAGDERQRALVTDYAKAVAGHQPGGHLSWGYGYETLFLAEYVLATRDATVMEGLRRLTTDIAKGASRVGTWGHKFARPEGNLNGYGCMNQPGIVLTLAMVLAREAGVADPVLDDAIARASGFLRWYVGKGALPYGDHDPWPWHEDNGKCSSAAVLFDCLGDRDATTFFARMAAAAWGERESGHTGNFFNVTWALPGVVRCGPATAAAYVRKTAWYYDLARGWDGTCAYQGLAGDGRAAYSPWNCTGAFLLGFATPLQRLRLTGRKPSSAPALTDAAVAATIDAGRDFTIWTNNTSYAAHTTAMLMEELTSWSPAVRTRAAQAIGARDDASIPALIARLDDTRPETRYGACEALARLGPRADAAGDRMRALLADPDPWLRILAAEAVARMGPAVRKAAIPDLLRAATRQDAADRRERVQGALAEALFAPSPGRREPVPILAGGPLTGVDRPLLHAAIREVLTNQDGRIRSLVAPMYALFEAQDLVALLPDIVAAIRTPAPSGEMFAYGIRFAGLDLLARLRIREGMALCVDLMEEFRWGRKLDRCMTPLQRYGGAAKDLLPRLRAVRQQLTEQDPKWEGKDNDLKKDILALDRLIAGLTTAPAPPLIDLAAFIRSPVIPADERRGRPGR